MAFNVFGKTIWTWAHWWLGPQAFASWLVEQHTWALTSSADHSRKDRKASANWCPTGNQACWASGSLASVLCSRPAPFDSRTLVRSSFVTASWATGPWTGRARRRRSSSCQTGKLLDKSCCSFCRWFCCCRLMRLEVD